MSFRLVHTRWPWMALNGIIAPTLRYFTEFGSFGSAFIHLLRHKGSTREYKHTKHVKPYTIKLQICSQRCRKRVCHCTFYTVSTVWVKKVAPLKLFAVFSFLVNLCNWKLSWLLPKHILMSTPILVHLSKYLCEMYHFYRWDPSNFKNSIQFVTKFMNFS